MKALKLIVLAAVFSLIMGGCSSSKPETVAKDFLKAMYTGEFEKAASYCTESASAMMEMFSETDAETLKALKESNPKIKVTSVEISDDGESAEVGVTVKDYYEFGFGEVEFVEEEEEDDVDLKLVDGEWKVDISK